MLQHEKERLEELRRTITMTESSGDADFYDVWSDCLAESLNRKFGRTVVVRKTKKPASKDASFDN